MQDITGGTGKYAQHGNDSLSFVLIFSNFNVFAGSICIGTYGKVIFVLYQ